MKFPRHFPIGGHIIESWSEFETHEGSERNTGVIDIPVSTATAGAGPTEATRVIVSWRGYRHPEDGSRHFVAAFKLAGERLRVAERYEYMHVDERGTFRQRFRDSGYEACCTELVHSLVGGDELALEQIERGAYRGMWRCDVHVSRPEPADGVYLEELACRAVFNTARRSVLLFRWRYVESL